MSRDDPALAAGRPLQVCQTGVGLHTLRNRVRQGLAKVVAHNP